MTTGVRRAAVIAIQYLCTRRRWALHAFDARSTHAHLVVSAATHKPELVRDQCKAEILKQLRRQKLFDYDRPLWTDNGDIEYLDTDAEIEAASLYVLEAQDRKDRKDRDE